MTANTMRCCIKRIDQGARVALANLDALLRVAIQIDERLLARDEIQESAGPSPEGAGEPPA